MAIDRVERQRRPTVRHELPRRRRPVEKTLIRRARLGQGAGAEIPARPRDLVRIAIPRVAGDMTAAAEEIPSVHDRPVDGASVVDGPGGRSDPTGAVAAVQIAAATAASIDAALDVDFQAGVV